MGQMKITFINHASFFLESQAATLLCDPWVAGKAINSSWALFSPSPPVPYERVDYLWISHEHPDHFHVPTLRAIPESDRKRITVLYQKHSSPRMLRAFEELGFATVQELPLYEWVSVRSGLDVFCGSVGIMDSFLAVRTENECVLNFNDCFCNERQIRYIRGLVGGISLLFTQFSFANWIGNGADDANEIPQKLRDLECQLRIFRPEFTVPFASFSYFCNQENAWMNELMITPGKIAAMNLSGVHFLYPGDQWESDRRLFWPPEAVEKFSRDLQRLRIAPDPPGVEKDKILQAARKLLAELHGRFGSAILRWIEPFEIHIRDIQQILSIHPAKASCAVREATPEAAAQARYVMCSQVAWYTFAHTWGWNMLEASGMYVDREYKAKGENKLLRRCLNALSTEVLELRGEGRLRRALEFFWRKRVELFLYFWGGRDVAPAVPPFANEAAHTAPLAKGMTPKISQERLGRVARR